ncbi:MAG: ATP citrate lyase citrate-binding domain-containing protein [bacterium]|nr:ATP citrate lyase citrate-binding domain-containing protein [bacterium]
MNLYEFEGLQLFDKAEIPTPKRVLVNSTEELNKVDFPGPYVAKAQVLSGKRGKSGLIKILDNLDEKEIARLLASSNGRVLIEEKLVAEKEYYLSITYSTKRRQPVILFSEAGGVDIEAVKNVQEFPVDLTLDFSFKKLDPEVNTIVEKLWKVFTQNDARLAEINPLFKTKAGLVAVDAKVILDDDALSRHEDLSFEPRDVIGKKPTEEELAAAEIDKEDHRGSAGSSYMQLEGNIGIIAAGGGGSLVNMDALVALGGEPANYTEHSGNPPREKIEKLTKVVLGKTGLIGCWLVGATANFTDMYETLSGFVDGLRAIKPKPDYPIVIRRGGPRWEEAKAMLEKVKQEEGFDLHIFGPETPMTSTAKTMVELANKYKENKQ